MVIGVAQRVSFFFGQPEVLGRYTFFQSALFVTLASLGNGELKEENNERKRRAKLTLIRSRHLCISVLLVNSLLGSNCLPTWFKRPQYVVKSKLIKQ